jgi:hypothetical protein
MHIKSPTGTPDIPIGSVRVKPSTTTKIITANGTYNASSDNVDGYSSVVVNIPHSAAAAGGLIISNDALKLPLTMDSADPFEVVMCVRIDPDDIPSLPSFKVVFGSYEGLKRACYVQTFKDDGHIVFNSSFLWGMHNWDEGNYAGIYLYNAESVLDCDGETWNFLKIVKTADLKYQLWYSSDGMTYTLAEEAQLPNNMTNLYTFTPIIPAAQDTVSNNRWSLEDICLPNCYFKHNGTVVWGREI